MYITGVWRTCRWSRNTVCRKCPPGTFSGVQTGTLGCILCTKCNLNEGINYLSFALNFFKSFFITSINTLMNFMICFSELLQECSGVHDSICIGMSFMIYSIIPALKKAIHHKPLTDLLLKLISK